MSKRTDIHREGAIIPADYEYIFSYSLSTTDGGWPVPSYNANCNLDTRILGMPDKGHHPDGMCCIVGMHESGKPFAKYGTTGKCTICGASFIYGDIWRHIPSGEYIHVGHTCADKMNYVDRRHFEGSRERFVNFSMKGIRLEQFIQKNPMFKEIFDLAEKVQNKILLDMRENVRNWGSLTEKQVAFAMKIVGRINNPATEPAPLTLSEGRVTVSGRFVGVREELGAYGYVRKGMLLVSGVDGSLAKIWTTVPSGCDPTAGESSITLTLKRGGKQGHYFGSRPMFLRYT
jgi:hypothetical protein